MIAESNERISDSYDGMYVTVTAYLTDKMQKWSKIFTRLHKLMEEVK